MLDVGENEPLFPKPKLVMDPHIHLILVIPKVILTSWKGLEIAQKGELFHQKNKTNKF